MGRLEGLGMGLPLPPLWLCSKPLPILLISSSVQILTVMLSMLWGEKVVTPVRYVAKWGQHRTCWGPVHSRWNYNSVLALCKTSPFKCPTVQCAITFCHSSEWHTSWFGWKWWTLHSDLHLPNKGSLTLVPRLLFPSSMWPGYEAGIFGQWKIILAGECRKSTVSHSSQIRSHECLCYSGYTFHQHSLEHNRQARA